MRKIYGIALIGGWFVAALSLAAPGQRVTADRFAVSKDSRSALVNENKAGLPILVTDLSAPHGGNWFRGTLICSSGTWTNLNAGRYRIRYRVAVDDAPPPKPPADGAEEPAPTAGTARKSHPLNSANVSVWGEVLGSTKAAGQFRVGWARWLAVDLGKTVDYQDLDVVVDLPSATDIQPQFFWRRSTKEPGDITQIKLAWIEILPVPAPLVLSDALANKVHYREGEDGTGSAKVLNSTDQPQTGCLLVRLLTDLDTNGVAVHDQLITVPPRTEQLVAFPFPKLGRYGYELRAQVLSTNAAQILDARSDYFTVLNNVLEVGLSMTTPFVETAIWGPYGYRGTSQEFEAFCRRMNESAEACRRRYSNTGETPFWGPADCIKLVPQTEDWNSGQCKNAFSISRTKAVVDAAHKHGMTVQLYIQSLWGICDDGSYQQEHPEYFAYNAEGRPAGFDIRRPEPVDDHIRGLLGSIEMFGWDGARWDGHFDYCPPAQNLHSLLGEKIDTSNRDQLVADINDRIRKAVNAKHPLFTWGHNWNDQVESFTDSKEMISICANGSWIMNEAIKDSESPTSGTYRWADYAKRIASGSRMVRAKEGLYLAVAPPQYFAAGSQVLYKALLAFAGRAYLYGGAFLDRAPMDADLAAFMTRYARYIRGVEFIDVPDASSLVSVTAPREVWWRDYLTQKVTPAGVEQVLGLVNPPAVPAVTIEPAGALPTLQENIKVTFQRPQGMKRATATFLSPSDRPFQQSLPVALTGERAVVTVPELRYWNLIHIRWEE